MNIKSLSVGSCIPILFLVGYTPIDDTAETPSGKSAGGSGSATKQIASLSSTATETLYEIGAGGQVVAVDSFSDVPENAPRHDFSGFTPNPEAVIAEDSDLVIASVDANGLGAALDVVDIELLFFPAATTFEQIYDRVEQVGESTGHTDDAQGLVDRTKKEIEATVDSVDPEIRDVGLSYFRGTDSTLYSVGGATFIGQTCSLFGPKSVVRPDDDYPQLTNEVIIQANPGFVSLANHGDAGGVTEEDITFRPDWNETAAVKNKQIIPLGPDLASHWGPQLLQLIQNITEALRSYRQVPAPTQ